MQEKHPRSKQRKKERKKNKEKKIKHTHTTRQNTTYITSSPLISYLRHERRERRFRQRRVEKGKGKQEGKEKKVLNGMLRDVLVDEVTGCQRGQRAESVVTGALCSTAPRKTCAVGKENTCSLPVLHRTQGTEVPSDKTCSI